MHFNKVKQNLLHKKKVLMRYAAFPTTQKRNECLQYCFTCFCEDNMTRTSSNAYILYLF